MEIKRKEEKPTFSKTGLFKRGTCLEVCAEPKALERVDSHIVITLGYATQTHWLMVVREYINQKDYSIEYAEVLFSFWEHSFYQKGGIGPVPRRIN